MTRERILWTSVNSDKQHWEGLGDPFLLDLTNFFEDTVHLYPQRLAAEIIPHILPNTASPSPNLSLASGMALHVF